MKAHFQKLTLPLIFLILFSTRPANAKDVTLLNVSYDVTRELYKDLNPAFAAYWKTKTGDTVTINQSHGGSSKQARSVIDGLQADVVTMNQETDIDAIAQAGLLPATWSSRLPHHSAPYTSTIVFLVRKGNPKGIKDWDDLIKPGVSVIVPNPKTSGNGRYSYLAAWGYEHRKTNDDAKTLAFEKALFKNVPVLDTGGRGATTTFAQRGIGDVLLTFEAEVDLTKKELGDSAFDVVTPSFSILAEAPMAVVDKVATLHGTSDVAQAYLQFHFSPEGQAIIAKHHFRPRDKDAIVKTGSSFPTIDLLTVEEISGSWANAQKTHFADGGTFDQIYQK